MTASEAIGRQTGRKSKSEKGSIKVEADKDWLRLRFTHQGKRYAFALGLADSKVNRGIAEQKALQIKRDIAADHFDKSLGRYKPEQQSELHRVGWLTAPAMFREFVECRAKEVTLKTMEKYRATLRYVEKFFSDKPVDFLGEEDATAFVEWQLGQGLSVVQVKRRVEELEQQFSV